MEATGGLKVGVACSLQAEGFEVAGHPSRQARDFALQWDILRRPTELMPESLTQMAEVI